MANMLATVTYDDGYNQGQMGRIRKVIIDFLTDDSAGTATVTTRNISGELIKIVTDPGSPAPTANYDVVLTDDEGVDLSVHMDDVAIAALIARHTTNTEETYLPLEDTAGTARIAAWPVICGPLTVSLANAGNAKATQVIIYYRV
jgi:hypothetical protein